MLSISKILEVTYPTLFNFIKKRNMQKGSQKAKQKDSIAIKLCLRIENNSKFVRGKKPSTEDIENWVIPNYDQAYKKLHTGEYLLEVPYINDKELDDKMEQLLVDIALAADNRNCHTEETSIEAIDIEGKYWD